MFNCRWKFNGRKYPEFDCWGFVKWLYEKEHEAILPDYQYDLGDDNSKYFNEELSGAVWQKVKPQKGALVPLTVNGTLSHIGFMVDNTHFAHIMKTSGVSLASINSPKWSKRIAGFYMRKEDIK